MDASRAAEEGVTPQMIQGKGAMERHVNTERVGNKRDITC